jgi:hypothetical protein
MLTHNTTRTHTHSCCCLRFVHYTTRTSSAQNAVHFGFVQELWCMRGLDAFQFDSHLLLFASTTGGHVGAEINISKGSATNLASETVLFSHLHFHDDNSSIWLTAVAKLLPPDGHTQWTVYGDSCDNRCNTLGSQPGVSCCCVAWAVGTKLERVYTQFVCFDANYLSCLVIPTNPARTTHTVERDDQEDLLQLRVLGFGLSRWIPLATITS